MPGLIASVGMLGAWYRAGLRYWMVWRCVRDFQFCCLTKEWLITSNCDFVNKVINLIVLTCAREGALPSDRVGLAAFRRRTDAHPVDLGFLGSWPFRREDPRL